MKQITIDTKQLQDMKDFYLSVVATMLQHLEDDRPEVIEAKEALKPYSVDIPKAKLRKAFNLNQ